MKDRVSALVKCGYALLFVGYDLALLLGTDTHFQERFPDIRHLYELASDLCRLDSSLIHEVLKVRSGKARRRFGYLVKINILRERLVLAVHIKDLASSLDVGSSYSDLPVKTTRSHDRGIEDIHTVCGREDYDPLIDSEPVHLNEQLVKRLLSFVMTAAHTGSAPSCNGIYLIDEHDARCVLFGLLKQIPYTAGTDTDKHFHKVRA